MGAGSKLTIAVVVAAAIGVAGYLGYQRTAEPAPHAGPPTARIITQGQYANTIAYIFGEDIQTPPQFPPVSRVEGLLALGAAEASLTPGMVERFYRYGKQVADQVMAPPRRAYVVPCGPADPGAADAACARQFITTVGRLLYRRALTDSEADTYVRLAGESADSLGDFYEGLRFVLSGMLASPSFVLITDRLADDPGAPGAARLDAYSRASRLSFFLWNSAPDERLLRAAESGVLDSREGVETEVARMISSPRLRHALRGFFADMLHFDEFENLAKDNLIYPAYGPGVSGDAAEQMLRMITRHLVEEQGDYRDLFTTTHTYMSQSLGAVYQLPVNPENAFVPYEFPDHSGRAGLLSHVGFLSLHSHPGRSSPTRRGEGVRESLLCQPVPLPPPNVDFSNFEDPAGEFKTARERLVRHSSDAACANCHRITDPIGLGLENFDGAGQYRARENGALIDASGDLDGIPFDGALSLGEAVKKNPATTACLVERLFAYGVSRPMDKEDRPVLDYFERRFADTGYRIPALMRRIALSEAFFAVGQPVAAEAATASLH